MRAILIIQMFVLFSYFFQPTQYPASNYDHYLYL